MILRGLQRARALLSVRALAAAAGTDRGNLYRYIAAGRMPRHVEDAAMAALAAHGVVLLPGPCAAAEAEAIILAYIERRA